MNWIILPLIWAFIEQEYLASPIPLKLSGHSKKLTPYIRYWEVADFDRATLDIAHQKHIEQKHHRWKRSMGSGEYGPAHVIRLNFFAHDKEFRLNLKQDPLSVFASDVQFENTLGPIDFDISRIYTGNLEDEDSRVHAVLTNDNLLDGTIETSSDFYYIEPTHRYSRDLYNTGVHSIIYKVNDVDMKKYKNSLRNSEHCASERLRLKKSYIETKEKFQNSSNSSNEKLKNLRIKRWLPDEYVRTDNDRQDPPLPLDLDVPYNDEMNIFTNPQPTPANIETIINKKSIDTAHDNEFGAVRPTISSPTKSRPPFRRGDNYKISNRSYDRTNSEQKIYTKHKNIIVSTYDNSNSNNNNVNRSHFFDRQDDFNDFKSNKNNSNDRPSHKTHVEIITKNGATRKPYIIVNNYNPPDLTTNVHHPQFNSMLMTTLLSNKGPNSEFPSSTSDSANSRSNYNRKITCMLYLQADHTFFQKMGSDEASIEAITRHVQRANTIYKNTDFNNDGKPDNITFMIKRIKVHNMNALNDPTYRFPGNYGVEKFLELFSEEDYDAFCLAYMFTYRDFEMGTLGLAWTGDLKNAGGVCEKNGHYRGSLKSLNTGIVTLLNYGKHVPPAVSHVTLAHEIGHNFGSPHDPEQCTPGGEDGNFIMFARATSGDKKNNNKFSPCSLKSIEPVLNSKARSAKGCFTEPQTSICGNGVVEPGEECDCGWEEDCKDTCCFPMSRHPRMDERPCTLTPGSLCSQSQGPCCTGDCRLKFGDKCRDDNGCRDPSFCDGRMPQCPPSVNKPNKTICNKEFVCFMGECTGSICLAYGLESCQCIPGEHDDKIKSCELCCKLPGEDKPCRSSFEWNEAPYDVPNMYAKPGTPCNDYNGYCDVFQKCREVDPSGPLATLRKLLLSEESIATFKNWMQQNWYAVVLGTIGILVLLILSTKLLAKRSNLKLKTVTIIHSATTETVRLPTDNNGVIVHRAVRTKVPFKKKVRGKRNVSKKKVDNKSNVKETKDRPSEALNELNLKRTQSQSQQQQQQLQQLQQHKKSNSSGGTGSSGNDVTEVATTTPATTTTVKGSNDKSNNASKKTSHSKKHSKEIIDYSKRTGYHDSKRASLTTGHTNTFHKVQKWLLESPIVAQPLSHIEHSSKVRKVMSKSQSTPERLLHKSPQKSKSMNNVTNDKVRMQVVYKPFKFSPFKFSLRFSKNAKVRTHVLGNNSKTTKTLKHPFKATGRSKRPNGEQNNSVKSPNEKNVPQTRTAFLLQKQEEDNQNLNSVPTEPNYETLKPNPKSFDKSHSNENFYEIAPIDIPAAAQLSRSSSKTTYRASKVYNPSEATRSSFNGDTEKLTGMHKSRDISGSTTSINNKFGSTQNLIKTKDTKNRHSINSRSSRSREAKDTALPHSSSGVHVTKTPYSRQLDSIENAVLAKHPTTRQLSSSSSAGSSKHQQQQQPTAAQRNVGRSQNNIPRASVSNNFLPSKDVNEMEKSTAPPLPPPIAARTSINMPMTKTASASSITERAHQRSNSLRQQPHSFVPPPLPRNSVPNDEKLFLPSDDMDQSISDIEYLVS